MQRSVGSRIRKNKSVDKIESDEARAMEQVLAILLIFLCVPIVFANGTVCGLILGTKHLRTPSNFLVMSLALSDLFIGAVLIPVNVALPESPVNGYFTAIILLSSVASLCGISFDRYTAVIRPFQHRIILRKHFRGIIITTWSVPTVVSLAPLVWHTNSTKLAHRIYLTVLCALVIGPYLLVFTVYYRIFRKLKEHSKLIKSLHISSCVRRKANRVSSETKVTQLFFLLVIMFLISWCPVLYTTLAFAADRMDIVPSFLDVVSLFTLSLISLVNPILYSLGKTDLRCELKRLVCKSKGPDYGFSGKLTTQIPLTDDQDTQV